MLLSRNFALHVMDVYENLMPIELLRCEGSSLHMVFHYIPEVNQLLSLLHLLIHLVVK